MGSFVAVELVFDPEAARRLTVLQDRLAAIYGGSKITELGVKPHLSLNLFPDGEPAFLCDELEELARRFNPFPVQLDSVESFPTAEGVVYLAPDPNAELQAVHRRFHARLAAHGEPGHPYYRPGRWVPHCTVASEVPAQLIGAVMGSPALAEAFGKVRVEAIQAVAYRPIQALYSFPLRGPQIPGE